MRLISARHSILRSTGRLLILLTVAICCARPAAIGLAADRRGPFTEPPRSVRSRTIDQQHVRLELRLDLGQREARGRAIHTLTPLEPLQTIEFDAAEMVIERVTLVDEKGRPRQPELKFESRDQQLSITLDHPCQPGEPIRLAIDYCITEPERGMHFVIPGQDESDQGTMVWTHSEPIDARYWFPCFDSPTDRLTSEILVTVPAGLFVLANGVLKSNKGNEDGTHTWHWVQEQSHVTYLLSVVAGDFEAYEQQWDGIPVVSYVPKGRMADAARSFEKTPAMLEFFSEKIGYRYPWPKYAQICVDEYRGGGMEHTSATTLTLRTLHDERAHLETSSDGLVSHELAHQWWGNLLTCKDWAELWLNEGFATYFATVWTEHDLGEDEALWQRHEEAESYFTEDKDRYRRPIVTYRYRKPGDMFDRHSYPKSARVLHMLRFILGEEAFWKAIHHYCKKHEFGTVETADFRIAVEEATGQGLAWFFDQWVYHGGHPEYQVCYEWDDQARQVRITVKQTQEVDDLTPLFRMPIEIELVTPRETITRRITVSRKEETFHFALQEQPRRVCFDPRDWVLKKLTFEKDKEEWLDQAAHDVNVICRVRAVGALGEFTDDKNVLAALTKVAQGDTFWAVRRKAVEALGKFSGEPARAALLRAAREDPKSLVRRKAIETLGKFPHDETRETLRHVIKHDRSYYAVAEALRALVQVDRSGCRRDLLAAVEQQSHQDVILKAAADGLAELKDQEAAKRLSALFEGPSSASRKVAVMDALAQLGQGDRKVTEALGRHLSDARHWVRSAACEALGKTDDSAAIELLLAQRSKETSNRVVRTIDDNLAKLRQRQQEINEIRQQVEDLQEENRKLRERVKKLEEAATP